MTEESTIQTTQEPKKPARKRGPLSEKHKAKISAAKKGKPFSAEHKANIAAANKNRTVSDETRAKLSAANKGKTFSAETRAKLSAAHKGKTLSVETRAKISKAAEPRTRKVDIFCYRTDKLIAESVVIARFAREHNYSHICIGATARGVAKKTGCEGLQEFGPIYARYREAAKPRKNSGHRARPADIFCYRTGKLIAENVVIAHFAKEHGYNRSCLGKTAQGKAEYTGHEDYEKFGPVYARYRDKK